MSGSTFGKIFRVTTWGESHGAAVGVIVDGCPAGLSLSEADIQTFLDRRKPGQNKYTTRRSEADTVEILSGVFEGYTTGTPISMVVRNKDQRSHTVHKKYDRRIDSEYKRNQHRCPKHRKHMLDTKWQQ